MERRRIRFHGQVQGVGFRATARAVAAEYTVSGWVRNESDGTVLLEVQGHREVVESFLTAIRGHARGHVSAEHHAAVPIVEAEAGFDIRR